MTSPNTNELSYNQYIQQIASMAVAPKTFYVYEHWRSDTNLPFYVGKGKGSRATDMANGSNYPPTEKL
jgi:hypothetical protein